MVIEYSPKINPKTYQRRDPPKNPYVSKLYYCRLKYFPEAITYSLFVCPEQQGLHVSALPQKDTIFHYPEKWLV